MSKNGLYLVEGDLEIILDGLGFLYEIRENIVFIYIQIMAIILFK